MASTPMLSAPKENELSFLSFLPNNYWLPVMCQSLFLIFAWNVKLGQGPSMFEWGRKAEQMNTRNHQVNNYKLWLLLWSKQTGCWDSKIMGENMIILRLARKGLSQVITFKLRPAAIWNSRVDVGMETWVPIWRLIGHDGIHRTCEIDSGLLSSFTSYERDRNQ